MSKYFKYLLYIVKHKWYVMIGCFKQGIPFQGILHDWTKFKPMEFVIYANHYYGKGDKRINTAFLKHIHSNPHHWQYWLLLSGGRIIGIEIPLRYRKEMLADWVSSNRVKKVPVTPKEWYFNNRKKMLFAPKTRKWLDTNILNYD